MNWGSYSSRIHIFQRTHKTRLDYTFEDLIDRRFFLPILLISISTWFPKKLDIFWL